MAEPIKFFIKSNTLFTSLFSTDLYRAASTGSQFTKHSYIICIEKHVLPYKNGSFLLNVKVLYHGSTINVLVCNRFLMPSFSLTGYIEYHPGLKLLRSIFIRLSP